MTLVFCYVNRKPDEEDGFVEENFDYGLDHGSAGVLHTPRGDGVEPGGFSAPAQAGSGYRH